LVWLNPHRVQAIPRWARQYQVRVIKSFSIFLQGGSNMTLKSPTIQQGRVTELMAQLAKLPEREKAPDDPISLSEIFRAKEYAAEIRGVLKRGYSFGDLAEIFTGMCGAAINEGQTGITIRAGRIRERKANPAGRPEKAALLRNTIHSGIPRKRAR
jgi:hypothetical protein